MEQRARAGFTLMELLIFSAIFSLIIGVFITILLAAVSVQSSQSASGETQQQGQFLDQQLQYYIEGARLVDMTQDSATTTLTLRESVASSSLDPTIFTLSSGTVYLQQGVLGALVPLTSKKVTITNLSFTRHYNLNSSSSPIGTDSVSYSYTVSAAIGQSQYSQQFGSSATVLAPVGQVALLQQAKAENNTASNASVSKAFPTANESGDLLLAVVAYQGSGTSSISDTLGNAWIPVMSTSSGAYAGTVTLYAAANSKAGANTTTAAFASGATYTSLFIYEYRGAVAISPVNVSAMQLQLGTSAPTSPSVSPTSNVELLFGIDDNLPPAATSLSPGIGYTLESSSTAGNTTQVYVEDMSQYVTNPVAASWTGSGVTTSTAMIATIIAGNGTPSYNTGMVGYWALDEGSGSTANDTSGSGNTGTWTGPVYGSGKVGPYSGTFDGSTNYISMGMPVSLQPTTTMSVAAWVKLGTTQTGRIIAGVWSSNNSRGYALGIDDSTSNHIKWVIGYTSNFTLTSNAALTNSTWTHVVGVYDGSSMYIYINGVLDNSASSSHNPVFDAGSQFNIAKLGGFSLQYFNGSIDDVRVYNRALSAAEVSALYNAQK